MKFNNLTFKLLSFSFDVFKPGVDEDLLSFSFDVFKPWVDVDLLSFSFKLNGGKLWY